MKRFDLLAHDVSLLIATLERLAQLGVGFGFKLEVFAQTRELQLDVHERALVSLLRLDGGVEFRAHARRVRLFQLSLLARLTNERLRVGDHSIRLFR